VVWIGVVKTLRSEFTKDINLKWHDEISATILPKILISKPNNKYARRRDRQFHLEELSTHWCSSDRNTSLYKLYWNNEEGADLKVIVVNFMTVFVTRRDSVYTNGCGHIVSLTPVNNNIPWSFRHTSIGKLFMLDQGCGRATSPSRVRRQFLADTCASRLKGKNG